MERVLKVVILQELGLTGSWLILGGFQGDDVLELGHFRSFNTSHQFMPMISRAP